MPQIEIKYELKTKFANLKKKKKKQNQRLIKKNN